MKVSLMGLPNTLRGGAWPSSACTARCPVKSGNKRDLRVQLRFGKKAHCADCSSNGEEGAVYDRWPAPNPLGYTRAAMLRTMRCNSERRS